ncbi:copper resistance CopC family protein [Micromonospora sediminicola]|uniref:copper resistance CopC family protein n=1 Tax=Micromonospora sediminicola TaxID=946078 RepID=UPI0033FC6DF0
MSATRRALAVVTALATVGIAVTTINRQPDGEAERVLTATPADGSALATAPGQVTLRLSSGADPVLSHVTVRDSTGATVNDGQAKTDGRSGLRQPVRPLGTGDYSVAFHITFTNGQDDIGVLRFSVGTGAAPRDDGEIPEAITDPGGHAHGVDPIGATLLVVDGLVLLAVIILLLRPRRRAGTPTSADGSGSDRPERERSWRLS